MAGGLLDRTAAGRADRLEQDLRDRVDGEVRFDADGFSGRTQVHELDSGGRAADVIRVTRRVLIVSWASFLHGEATAGDVLAMDAARDALSAAGVACDLAWSPVFRPGGRTLEDASPGDYTHLVFTCGPAHGWQVEQLHERYAGCYRIAVGVSVIDPADPAVTGFHQVLPRDVPGRPGRLDLAATVPVAPVPVAAVVLAGAQPEYAGRGRHSPLTAEIGSWLATVDCARVPVDTRLAPGDWRSPGTAAQVEAVISRADVVVTTRLHGLVLALKNGVPALAIDPVAGGAKVAAQAAAWGWPVLLARPGDAEPGGPGPGEVALGKPLLDRGELDRLWAWCRSAAGRARAGSALRAHRARPLTDDLLSAVGDGAGPGPRGTVGNHDHA